MERTDGRPTSPRSRPPKKSPEAFDARSGSCARAAVSLARALSKLGHCSRTQGEALIRAGRVTVNGEIICNPSRRVELGRDRICSDAQQLSASRHVYLMLNKPRGILTTRSDPQGRRTVYDMLSGLDVPFVSPVGRLDKASEGLLLMTNDTRWGQRLLDPASNVDKRYHVQVDRVPDQRLLSAMEAGVVSNGERLAVKAASVLRAGERNGWIGVVLNEGRNRHIRRLLEALDASVLRLVRVAVGGLELGDLAKGSVRPLNPAERAMLDVGAQPPPAANLAGKRS